MCLRGITTLEEYLCVCVCVGGGGVLRGSYYP